MINLTKAPFFLVKEDIEWVENTNVSNHSTERAI